MNDTSDSMAETYRALLLGLPPAERLRMACRMFDTARALLLAGLRRKLGADADPRSIRKAVFLRLYGHEFSESQRQAIIDALG
jgi:hypothetical protein